MPQLPTGERRLLDRLERPDRGTLLRSWVLSLALTKGGEMVARLIQDVAVLCVAKGSAYHGREGVDVFDRDRDAWNFDGSKPIVAHPPCRTWSPTYRHFAKPEPRERDLGLQCVKWLIDCGGVIEQPAKSLLFEAAGLPVPRLTAVRHDLKTDVISIEVWQKWWGFKTKKRTWLAIAGLTPGELPPIPFRLSSYADDSWHYERLSKRQRAETVEPFALWLLEVARRTQARRR